MTIVDAARVAEWEGPIVEVSSGKRHQGIPGAIQIDPCYVESATDRSRYYPRYDSPEAARLLPLDKLRQALGQLGLRGSDAVLLYGAGHLYPMGLARVAWALLAAGLETVAWLDGGLPAWQAAGGVLEPHRKVTATQDFGPAPDRYSQLVTSDLSGFQGQLADLRSHAEYTGKQQDRYPFFRSCGHIPGALWAGNWTRLMRPGPAWTFRPLAEIQKDWLQQGIVPDREVVFYCGTGWRSSLACLVARQLGYARVRNYDGGIFAWSATGGPLIEGAQAWLASSVRHPT